MKTKTYRFIAVFLVFLMVPAMLAIPALASSLQASTGWSEYVEKMKPYKNAEDVGRRISSLAGNSKTADASGVKDYTVIVSAGGTYYVNGKEVTQGTDIPANLSTNYGTAIYTTTTLETTSGSVSLDIYVHSLATDTELGRVTSNISAGLLSQAGVSPDTGTAMALLNGVMPMINTVLGLIVTVISIGMTLFSALDVIYLAFPAFRERIDTQVEGGGKGTKTKKDGSTSSRWVSDDARNAVKETQENQQQPWGSYFKRRIVAYIFLAIILFILLTGNIFAITTIITNALSGLFQSLGIG